MEQKTSKASLLVIFLTVFIDLLGFGIVLPLLPIYADDFASEKAIDNTGWLIGGLMAIFSVMQFLFAPIWGRLSDRIGRRPVLMIGLSGSVVFYTLFGIATVMKDLTLLFVSRTGAGIAGATISTAQAYIADSTSLKDRPKGMALIGMAFGLGFTFGPLIGFLAVPTGKGDPGPWPGYVAAGLSLIALLLAIFKLPESRKPDRPSAARRTVIDVAAFRRALSVPSIGMLLVSIFVLVFSFANFEVTLSLLIKGKEGVESPFGFSWGQVCLTYAYIGITLAIIQGGIVRRIAGRVSEGILASSGALVEIAGFLLVVQAVETKSAVLLYGALAVIVTGFAFMQPSLNSLLSRRTDPDKQGSMFGVSQSVNSMARIFGSFIGIPLLKMNYAIPYYLAVALMGLGFMLVVAAARSGSDFPQSDSADEGVSDGRVEEDPARVDG
jgi:MFS family permease